MKTSYLISQPDYFTSKGKGGKISHVIGVIEGLRQNGVDIVFIGESQSSVYVDKRIESIIVKKTHGLFSNIKYNYKTWRLSVQDKFEYTIIRKNIYILLILSVLKLFKLNTYNEKTVWEVNGLTYTKHIDHWLGKYVFRVILTLHKYVLKDSKCVYVVNKNLKKSLTRGFCKVDDKKIVVIPNGSPKLKSEHTFTINNDVIRYLYFGVFQEYNNFSLLIEVFNRLNASHNNIELHFVGYGACESIVNNAVDNNPNIYNWGPARIENLSTLNILTNKTIGLIPMGDKIAASLGSPIKLYEYISLGLPIIMSDNTIIEDDLLSSKVLHKYISNDHDSLFLTMEQFIYSNNWDSYKAETLRIQDATSWKKRMSRLINFLNSKSI